MRVTGLLLGMAVWMAAGRGGAAALEVMQRNGEAHVAGKDLEREVGIVVKRLPGASAFVACGLERCARVAGEVAEGGGVWVPVSGLVEAMGLQAEFDARKRTVVLTPGTLPRPEVARVARVGMLAPNLRLPKLGGGFITLSELRGQRVLINSWASW